VSAPAPGTAGGIAGLCRGLDPKPLGERMHALIARLYPICRSITGEGVRETLRILGERLPLAVHEVASGTRVFDWQVPREWNVREAWLKGPDGNKVVDFADLNLHLLSYSVAVRRTLTLAELRPHLFSLPDRPDWVPYRTSYYQDNWGFCLPHRRLEALPEGVYEVCIDTTLDPGSLTYGELFLPGTSDQEILISCHVCHPSLANDNLSGIAVCAALAELLQPLTLRLGVRFVFIPGTIGSITWLARNEAAVSRIAAGIVAAGLGDPGRLTYKRSRRGDAAIDRAAIHVLRMSGADFEVMDFVPFGYDERQYGSPGFDLPVGSLTRTPFSRYPEYHTSADNPGFVRPEALADSLVRYLEVIEVIEGDRRFRNLNPKCEPQLGRRGLYRQVGGGEDGRKRELAILWVLNLSDGEHALLDIAERAAMPFREIEAAAAALAAAGLLAEVR
jgi:aminopeptidase-like protein